MTEFKFTKREPEKPEKSISRPLFLPSPTPPPPPPKAEKPQHLAPTRAERMHWATAPAVIFGLALVQVFAVWFSMRGLGMTWDEAYYFQPSQNAMMWLADWMSGNVSPATGNDPYWEETWELPGVPRFVNGFSGWLFGHSWIPRLYLFSPLVAQRMLVGLAHGLNCLLIGFLLLPLTGLGPALAAMLAYATMPHVFGHAHFAATETLMVTMMLLVTAAFLQGIEFWLGAVLAGALFGLALNTKFNLLLLPLPLWLWAWWHHRERMANNVMAMVLLAPIVWFLTWPWIWHDSAHRVFAYFDHFLGHAQTPVWFHGQKWGGNGPPAPWHYPLEMLAVTTPVPTLILGMLGVFSCLRVGRSDGRERLFLLLGAIPLLFACLPGAPRYDGVRLIFPVFAPLALIVGITLSRVRDNVLAIYPRLVGDRRFVLGFNGGALAIVALPGLIGIIVSHPYELSFHNSLVGGIAGAERNGYETTLWCEAVNEDVIQYMDDELPPDATIRPLALNDHIFDFYQQWGVLRGDLQFIAPVRGATDYHIIQGREGFFGDAEWFLWEHWVSPESRRFGWPRWAEEPAVPMVLVAQTGEAFEQALVRYIEAKRAAPRAAGAAPVPKVKP